AAKGPSQSTSYQFEALIVACEAMLGDSESAKSKCIQFLLQSSLHSGLHGDGILDLYRIAMWFL
ncbi:MAG: hypothetical protein AAFV33_27980, partial [Chloroflexota bacterium]